jgi:hypothetical protein
VSAGAIFSSRFSAVKLVVTRPRGLKTCSSTTKRSRHKRRSSSRGRAPITRHRNCNSLSNTSAGTSKFLLRCPPPQNL